MGFLNLAASLFPTRKLNKSLRILISVNTVMVFIVAMFAPFYAVFVQKIGGNLAIAGFTWAVYPIVAGVLTFLFSQWEMKVKEQELLMAVGYFIRGLVFLSYAFMGIGKIDRRVGAVGRNVQCGDRSGGADQRDRDPIGGLSVAFFGNVGSIDNFGHIYLVVAARPSIVAEGFS